MSRYTAPGAADRRLRVAPGGGAGVLDIDADLALDHAAPDQPFDVSPRSSRRLYPHVMNGSVEVDGEGVSLATLEAADAVVFFEQVPGPRLNANSRAELLRIATAADDPVTGAVASSSSLLSTQPEPLP